MTAQSTLGLRGHTDLRLLHAWEPSTAHRIHASSSNLRASTIARQRGSSQRCAFSHGSQPVLLRVADTHADEQRLWRSQQHELLLQWQQEPAQQVQQQLVGRMQQPDRIHSGPIAMSGAALKQQQQPILLRHGQQQHGVVAAATAATANPNAKAVDRGSTGAAAHDPGDNHSGSNSACSGNSSSSNGKGKFSHNHSGRGATASSSSHDTSSNSSSSSKTSSKPTSSSANGGISSISSIRERMRQRVASTATISVPANSTAPTAEGNTVIVSAARNDTGILDVLQSLKHRLGSQYSQLQGQEQPSNGAAALRAVEAPKKAAAGQAAAATTAASKRKAGSKQSRRNGRLLPGSTLLQRKMAFEELQKEFTAVMAANNAPTQGFAAQQVQSHSQQGLSTGTSDSSRQKHAAAAMAAATPTQSTSRRGRRTSTSSTATSPEVIRIQRTQRRSRQASKCATGATTAAPSDTIETIIRDTGAPAAVQQRLLHDCTLSLKHGKLFPQKPEVLRRRLMHYSQAAELLGGADRAADILERDSSLMVMSPGLLEMKLLNLQRLLSAEASSTAQQQNFRAIAAAAEAAASSQPQQCERLQQLQQELSLQAPQPGPHQQQQQQQARQRALPISPEVLGLVRAHPGVLRLSVGCLDSRLAAVQTALGLNNTQEALQVVRWQPRVLSMNEAALQQKVLGLSTAIRIPPSSIQALFARQPLLLNLSADMLVAKALHLQSCLGLKPQQLWEMLDCKPGVLLFSKDKVSSKWELLQRLAGSHARWQSELSELSRSSLVQLLTASDSRLQRLQHVAAVEAQEQQSLYYTVSQQGDARFSAKFPGFAKWLQEQQGLQQKSSKATSRQQGC